MNGSKKFVQLLVGTITVSLVAGPATSVYASIPDQERELNLSTVQPTLPLTQSYIFSKDFFVKYLPTNLTPTTNQTAFITQFNNSFQQKLSNNLVQSALDQQPAVKKLNDDVNKLSQKSLSLGPSNAGSPREIKFDVRASERKAVLAFNGFLQSNLTYTYLMDSNNAILALTKSLSKNTSLSLQNTSPAGQITPTGNLNVVFNF